LKEKVGKPYFGGPRAGSPGWIRTGSVDRQLSLAISAADQLASSYLSAAGRARRTYLDELDGRIDTTFFKSAETHQAASEGANNSSDRRPSCPSLSISAAHIIDTIRGPGERLEVDAGAFTPRRHPRDTEALPASSSRRGEGRGDRARGRIARRAADTRGGVKCAAELRFSDGLWMGSLDETQS
jgi:hypothetical protein